MNFLQAIILSVVEGVTEFLPISSTGHLILASNILRILQTDFVKSFEIIIQFGAILAIVFLYYKKFIKDLETWRRVLVAFIPTGILGFILYKIVKTYLLGNSMVVVVSLFLGGVGLIVIESHFAKKPKLGDVRELRDVSYFQAIIIGVCQSLAMVPGVSRSAATIIGGMFLGMSRSAAVEFSFLLAVPTMMAATGLDLVKSSWGFSGSEWMILGIGFLGAFVTAVIAVRWFVGYVERHSFVSFGIYRIILAIVYFLLFIK